MTELLFIYISLYQNDDVVVSCHYDKRLKAWFSYHHNPSGAEERIRHYMELQIRPSDSEGVARLWGW